MSTNRYESLDGMRGLAAMLVLLGHVIDTIFTAAAIVPHSIADMSARAGITLFFVLSGTVMYLGYGHISPFTWSSIVTFFGARFARLYPLYIASTMFYTGGFFFFSDKPLTAVFHLTMSQTWLNTMSDKFMPAWSISTECFFYIVFFAIFLPMRVVFTRHAKSPTIHWILQKPLYLWLAVLFFGLAIHVLVFGNLQKIETALLPLKNSYTNDIVTWVCYYNPYIRLMEFIVGITAGIYIMSNNSRRSLHILSGIGFALSAALFMVSLNAHGFGDYIRCNFLFAPVFSALIILSVKSASCRRIFTSFILMRSGKVSYSLYLLQFAIMTLATVLIPGADLVSRLIKAGTIVLFSYCIAYGSYYIIEQPARVVIRNAITRWLQNARRKEKVSDVVISVPTEG